jgi:hypothetical protein
MQEGISQLLEFTQLLRVALLVVALVLMDTTYFYHRFTRLAVLAAVPMVRLVLAVLVVRLVLVQVVAVAVAESLAARVVVVAMDI